MLHPNSTQINHSHVLLYSLYILQLQSTIITHIHISRINIRNVKMDVLSQVEKHVTYFLQQAISFRYSSATVQNKISLGQYIPNIIEYQIITHLPSDIHLKSINLSINLAKYKKQYSPSQTTMISVTSRPQCQILP